MPSSRALPHGVVVGEQPRELARREVRVERQPRALDDAAPASLSPIAPSSASWRLSCHTTTGVSARPLSASHASTDSPWWSSPAASTSRPPACSSTSATASTTACTISSGSCSTHPGRGCVIGTGRRASATARSSTSNSAALTAVVPSSIPSSSPELTGVTAVRLSSDGSTSAWPARAARVPPALAGLRRRGRRQRARVTRRDGTGLGEHLDDVLADAQRRGQPGGADRGDVDERGQRARALDHVVGVAPGGAQAGVCSRSDRARRARGTCAAPSRGSARRRPPRPTSRACPRARARSARRSPRGDRASGTRARPYRAPTAPAAGSARAAGPAPPRTRGTPPCAGTPPSSSSPALRASSSAYSPAQLTAARTRSCSPVVERHDESVAAAAAASAARRARRARSWRRPPARRPPAHGRRRPDR